eukprot:6194153-Pleurochrysis_carterae.AAC.2
MFQDAFCSSGIEGEGRGTLAQFPLNRQEGKIVRSGGPEIAKELEAEGYAFLDAVPAGSA